MKLIPYLNFDGDCEAAFEFYERVLGGKIGDKMTWEASPEENNISSSRAHQIMHMNMTLGDQEIMGTDAPPEYFEEPKGTSVLLAIDDPERAESVFTALGENGTVKMPIQETFWAARFGMLVDQFGTPWMINCDKTP